MDIIKSHTPTKTVPNSKLPPWLPRSLLSKIKLRRHTYHKASSTNSHNNWSKYRQLRNNITAEIHKSKARYLDSLSENPRRFWSYVRSLRRNHDPLPPLRSASDSPSAFSDQDKADSLNKAFSSFFNKDPPPPSIPLPPAEPRNDHLCSTEYILNLISSLPHQTSCGPDKISSFLIKSTAHAILIPLQHIFNLSISHEFFLLSGNLLLLHPFQKLPLPLILQMTIIQSPSYPFSLNS